MDLFEKAAGDIRKALKEVYPSVDKIEFEPPQGAWRLYVKRAIDLLNRAIERLKEYKRIVYEQQKLPEDEGSDFVPVVFLQDFGYAFLGPDAKTIYGPYKRGDFAYMHKEAARILEKHKIVRRLKIRAWS